MASVDWKGAKWEAYGGSLSIPELLTILKGHGPMEVLRFEIPGRFSGELSLCITEGGNREVTLYNLEVLDLRLAGDGRAALRWLRETFKGAIFLEFPDPPDPLIGFHPTMPFWLEMYKEGLIDSLDCEYFFLDSQATREQIDKVEKQVKSVFVDKQVLCRDAEKSALPKSDIE